MSVSLIFPSHSHSICIFLILKFNPYVFATFMHYGVNESTYIYLMHHDGMRLKMLTNIVLFAKTPENAQ
jgi:hypothetical protein